MIRNHFIRILNDDGREKGEEEESEEEIEREREREREGEREKKERLDHSQAMSFAEFNCYQVFENIINKVDQSSLCPKIR